MQDDTTAGPALGPEQELPSATQASAQKVPWITGQWAEDTWSYTSPAADVTVVPVEPSQSSFLLNINASQSRPLPCGTSLRCSAEAPSVTSKSHAHFCITTGSGNKGQGLGVKLHAAPSAWDRTVALISVSLNLESPVGSEHHPTGFPHLHLGHVNGELPPKTSTTE